jgi:hypothetical protein
VNIEAVHAEMAAKLRAADIGLNITTYQAENISPPAVLFDVPDRYLYSQLHGRGADLVTLPVMLLLGKASARSARTKAHAFATSGGPQSIKVILDNTTTNVYDSCDAVTVRECEIDNIEVASVVYLGIVFKVDIFGPGGTP